MTLQTERVRTLEQVQVFVERCEPPAKPFQCRNTCKDIRLLARFNLHRDRPRLDGLASAPGPAPGNTPWFSRQAGFGSQ